jgi:hypothetical protein
VICGKGVSFKQAVAVPEIVALGGKAMISEILSLNSASDMTRLARLKAPIHPKRKRNVRASRLYLILGIIL